MLEEKRTAATETHEEKQEKSIISRRKLLASLGMAGAALASSAIANGTVMKAFADPSDDRTKVKDLMKMNVAEMTTIIKTVSSLPSEGKTGEAVYWTGFQGGLFVHDESQKNLNDGVVNFNGWVRQIENATVSPSMAGFVDGGSGVDAIKKCLSYLKTNGGGTILLDDGLYILDADSLTKDPVADQSDFRYWFEPVSNVTIKGSRNAVWKVADGVVAVDAFYKYAKGYQVFSSKETHENFRLDGFTFDGNAQNNLVIPIGNNPYGNQSQCHFIAFEKAKGFEASNLTIISTSGRQIFCFRRGCSGHSVHHCHILDNGNIKGNVNLTDHSSIYNEGDHYSFYHNRLVNSEFDTVSTAIETHGANGFVYGNYIQNYNLGIIRAAMRSDSYNVSVYGNIGIGLTTCFMYDAADGHTLKTNDHDNQFKLRDALHVGSRALCAINTGGQFSSNNTGDHEINAYNNVFKTETSGQGVAIIGGKVPCLRSENTYDGFAVYFQHGTKSGKSVNKIVLKDKIRNLSASIDRLITVYDWDGSITTYSIDFDLEVKELLNSGSIQYIMKSDLSTATLKGTVAGNFEHAVYPYYGAWNNNTMDFDYSCQDFNRVKYTLEAGISLRVKTPSATYQRLVNASSITSSRYSYFAPTASGSDVIGDIVYATAPTTSLGWIYTSLGWKEFGAIKV